jgi:DNA-binding LacI/PurR family transcriptional regulator
VRELAERYGLSNRVVNIELQKLSEEGILETIPRVGTFVRGNIPQPARSFLGQAVVIVGAPAGQGIPWHQEEGWGEGIIAAAIEEVNRRGFDIVSVRPERMTESIMARVAAERPYGVVLPDIGDIRKTVGLAETLRSSRIPFTVYGDAAEFARYDRVVGDHEATSYELTKWLIEIGRRRIICAWPSREGAYWYPARFAGYRRALVEAGLPVIDPVMVPTATAIDGVYPDFKDFSRHVAGYLIEYITGDHPADAIMAASDAYVFAIAQVCKLVGKVPNVDIALVGYDNVWRDMRGRFGDACPPMATVDKQNRVVGVELVRLLDARASGDLADDPQVVCVGSKLIRFPQQ